ncbi:MAG: RNA 2',3'-cyclic phosphodiesterase [Candidatus Aenigmarchaeota archaeon]|nr:RNA 2',3'-cyclic phosphodiesterase [Candidatus Aenigmarchaeota archaeon]
MRSFIAIEIEKNVLDEARKVINDFRNLEIDVKFVEPDNLHLTLKFLGEISENDVKIISDNISDVCKGVKKFKISFKGVSFFGSKNRIRTLWVGVERGYEDFIFLSKCIDAKIDFKKNVNHSPHLTIGRVKSGRNMELMLEKIDKYDNVNIGEMEVNSVKLKKSTLTPKGPIYEDVSTFYLTC